MVNEKIKRVDKDTAYLAKLASDIVDGKVFGSWNITKYDRKHVLCLVFMPILFLDDPDYIVREKIVALYEYTNKKRNNAINGYPTFLSCNTLNKQELNKLIPMIKKIEEKKEAIIKELTDGI